MGTLKLGIVGAGFVAQFHARAIMQVRSVEIAGVTSRTTESAQAFSAVVKQHGLGDGVAYPSVTEMAKHVDAIAIYCPNFARVAIMEEIADAVRAGATLKGVICEKPLARTVAEAKRLIALAKHAKVPTAYFENQIHMKPIRRALEQLAPQQKTMGPITLARADLRAPRRCEPA